MLRSTRVKKKGRNKKIWGRNPNLIQSQSHQLTSRASKTAMKFNSAWIPHPRNVLLFTRASMIHISATRTSAVIPKWKTILSRGECQKCKVVANVRTSQTSSRKPSTLTLKIIELRSPVKRGSRLETIRLTRSPRPPSLQQQGQRLAIAS